VHVLVDDRDNSFYEVIKNSVIDALRIAVTNIPPDIEEALRRAYREEVSDAARAQLGAILEDIEIARKYNIPICQDTGLIHYYVSVGVDFPGLKYVEKALIDATREATYKIPLRPNTVNPFTHENPGDNTGRYAPIIHWELVDGDFLDIIVVPRGGDSEAVTMLRMPPPGRGLEALVETVVDAVLEAGAKPCPPVIIGVGVGGGADTVLYLAKKAATTRRIGYRNPDPLLASLEEKLLEELNKLGIGVMGLGGNHTVLDVHIDYAYTHPVNYPIAIAFQCWAARRAFIRVDHTGKAEIKQ
jgi:fumarate hydratase subunit alpha